MSDQRCWDCGRVIRWKRVTLKNQGCHIRGRSIEVRNINVSTCRHAEQYECLGPMLDLLKNHPRKKVVTWHPKTRRWT